MFRKLLLISLGSLKMDGFSAVTLLISGPKTPLTGAGGFCGLRKGKTGSGGGRNWGVYSQRRAQDDKEGGVRKRWERSRKTTHSARLAHPAVPGIGGDGVKLKGRVEAREVEGARAAVAAQEVALPATGIAVVIVGL